MIWISQGPTSIVLLRSIFALVRLEGHLYGFILR